MLVSYVLVRLWCLVLLRRTDEQCLSVRTVRRMCHGLPLRAGLLWLRRYINHMPSGIGWPWLVPCASVSKYKDR